MFELGVGVVAFRLGLSSSWVALAGSARQRITFFACAKKVTKESAPRFAALRVPKFSPDARAAAQLALRAQTVLADGPRASAENLAAQRGFNTPSPALPRTPLPLAGEGLGFAKRSAPRLRDAFPPPLTAPRISGAAGGRRRKLSERSEFFRRPVAPEILGVSPEAGRAFFGYFLCTNKESNAPPGAPGQTPFPYQQNAAQGH